jgi:hypothetical protein
VLFVGETDTGSWEGKGGSGSNGDRSTLRTVGRLMLVSRGSGESGCTLKSLSRVFGTSLYGSTTSKEDLDGGRRCAGPSLASTGSSISSSSSDSGRRDREVVAWINGGSAALSGDRCRSSTPPKGFARALSGAGAFFPYVIICLGLGLSVDGGTGREEVCVGEKSGRWDELLLDTCDLSLDIREDGMGMLGEDAKGALLVPDPGAGWRAAGLSRCSDEAGTRGVASRGSR